MSTQEKAKEIGQMEQMELLEAIKDGVFTVEEVNAELERLVKVRSQKSGGSGQRSIYYKVSKKGAMSIYGLQRMPVTLYVNQWERVFGTGPEVLEWIDLGDDMGKGYFIPVDKIGALPEIWAWQRAHEEDAVTDQERADGLFLSRKERGEEKE